MYVQSGVSHDISGDSIQGDFMVHFMDLATTELYKHTGDISISKLQGLLQIALKQSAAVNDSFAEKIRCTLERYQWTV